MFESLNTTNGQNKLETIVPPQEDVYIKTENGAMRGELISQTGNERIIRCTWSHDGVGVGLIVKMDTRKLKAGEPIILRFSSDDGKTYGEEHTGGVLIGISRWEKGVPVTVEDLIRKTDNHLESVGLPENKKVSEAAQSTDALREVEKVYVDALPEYEHIKEAFRFAMENKKEAKCNFLLNNTNAGWKAHLNISPENVVQVANYLKNNEYAHKYLTGGEGGGGKAFTVYFGSKGMMDKWSEKLGNDLRNVLCKPAVTEEAEVAPGVVARFTSMGPDGKSVDDPQDAFLQYGMYGLSARREFVKNAGGWKNISTPEEKLKLALDSYKHLSRLYGSYFHG
ncbi:MAG: hypothetical protein AAB510_02690 [Patescibacteria group bacterium]